jgi:hypothetical protein
MKICKDCKHYYHDPSPNAYFRGAQDLCGADGRRDPVDGTNLYRLCRWMRAPGHPCGDDGKLFEAKP